MGNGTQIEEVREAQKADNLTMSTDVPRCTRTELYVATDFLLKIMTSKKRVF